MTGAADPSHPSARAVVGLYERHAAAYDRDRARTLVERSWLDRFLALVVSGGSVLDLGCGMGEPLARAMVDAGFEVVGVDSSPGMIERCRARMPAQEWIVGDMREIALGRRFAGILAWDSFFHLTPADQRGMFARFAAHAARGAPLMFTSGTSAGEAIGDYEGEPLYHSSLSTGEYRRLLQRNGFALEPFVAEDATCGGHTIWLATRSPDTTGPAPA